MTTCPEQWKIDVNDRYARGVSVVTSLSTASLVLPILFLKDIIPTASGKTLIDYLTCSAFIGWFFLGASILSGVIYFYFSAKWVKSAWGEDADTFGREIKPNCIETWLDNTFFIMMGGFLFGITSITIFMVTFKHA